MEQLSEQQKLQNRYKSIKKTFGNVNCLTCIHQGKLDGEMPCVKCNQKNYSYTRNTELEELVLSLNPCDSCMMRAIGHCETDVPCQTCGIPPVDAEGIPIPGCYSYWTLDIKFVKGKGSDCNG